MCHIGTMHSLVPENDVGHKALEPLRIKEEHGVHARVVAGATFLSSVSISVLLSMPRTTMRQTSPLWTPLAATRYADVSSS